MEKILEFIESRECEIVFRWIDKKTEGKMNVEKEIICLNLHLMIASAFLHEYFHYIKDSNGKSEAEIEAQVDKFLKSLRVGQIQQIAHKVMEFGVNHHA